MSKKRNIQEIQLLLPHLSEEDVWQKRKTDEKQLLLPDLPEEIIDEIVKRLPVECLVRFSCTCKRWRSLIFCDSKFNNAHILDVKRPSWKLIPEIRFETSIDCDCNVATTTRPIYLTLTNTLLCDSFPLGCCNGILLIRCGSDKSSDRSRQLFLWNPYINSFKWINPQIDQAVTCENYFWMHGLSYDRVSDDYKAIIVVTLYNYDEGSFTPYKRSPYEYSPFVFSLRRNLWKKLSDFSTVHIFETARHGGQPGITLDNGICHWKVQLECERSAIICFDPVVDKFKDIPLPDTLRGHLTGRLGALDGCLSLIHVNSVWVMKEYGCWTKLYQLGLPYDATHYVPHRNRTYWPIGYNSSKDQVIVVERQVNFGRFWIADVKKRVVRRPSDNRFTSINESSRNLYIYTESLICPWLRL